MVHDQRVTSAQVAIRGPEHDPVADRIEGRRARSGLRDARTAPAAEAGLGEGRYRQGHRLDVAVERAAPVGAEAVEHERAAREPDRGVRFSRRRRHRSVQVGGSDAADVVVDDDALLRGGGGGKHLDPVERAVGDAVEAAAAAGGEGVVGDVVAVRPDAELRVVVEIRIRVVVARPLPGGVRRPRDGDALVIRTVGAFADGELRDQPTVRQRIVEGDPVAVVARLAVPAEAGEQRPRRDRAQQRASVLREHHEARIHDLYVVGGTDVSLGIGRHAPDFESPPVHPREPGADPVEAGGGPRQQQRGDRSLEHGIAPWRHLHLVRDAAWPLFLALLAVHVPGGGGEERQRRGDVAPLGAQHLTPRGRRHPDGGGGEQDRQQPDRASHPATLGLGCRPSLPQTGFGSRSESNRRQSDGPSCTVLDGRGDRAPALRRPGMPPSPGRSTAAPRPCRRARCAPSPARIRAPRCGATGTRSARPTALKSPAR